MLTKNIQSTKSSEVLPNKWETSDSSITADDVIDAYFLGKKDGVNEEYEKLKKEFLINLKLASSIAEELFGITEDNKLALDEVYLKVDNFNSFDILFLVNESIYNDNLNIRNVYALGRNLKNKYQSDRVKLNFSFAPNSNDLCKSSLYSDGYLVKYEKKD